MINYCSHNTKDCGVWPILAKSLIISIFPQWQYFTYLAYQYGLWGPRNVSLPEIFFYLRPCTTGERSNHSAIRTVIISVFVACTIRPGQSQPVDRQLTAACTFAG